MKYCTVTGMYNTIPTITCDLTVLRQCPITFLHYITILPALQVTVDTRFESLYYFMKSTQSPAGVPARFVQIDDMKMMCVKKFRYHKTWLSIDRESIEASNQVQSLPRVNKR